MSDTPTSRLPEGWYPAAADEARGLHDELRRELPPGHLLFGRDVEAVAYKRACDDVLFRHRDQPERFTIIHLTWIRKQETDARYPSVCFDGTFEGFLEDEKINR